MRQSETEPATKTVAEVAHARAGSWQWCASNAYLCEGHSSGGTLLLTGRRRRRDRGFERSLPDLMAGNARRYGHSDKLALCRDVMYEKSL